MQLYPGWSARDNYVRPALYPGPLLSLILSSQGFRGGSVFHSVANAGAMSCFWKLMGFIMYHHILKALSRHNLFWLYKC